MTGICRFCKSKLVQSFCDLGMSPLSNSYLSCEQLNQKEEFYPLHAYVCDKCLLVQLDEYAAPEHIFSDYAYFSSYSKSWLEHAKNYVESVIGRYSITSNNQVIEIASNDGYLLQYFRERNIPVLGIEPAANVADVAEKKGIPTKKFFLNTVTASKLIKEGIHADLLLGNNVLAHVPDLNDFIQAMKMLLHEEGIITMEFPHLMQLIKYNQFDTIYHEHFSYFSMLVVDRIFSEHGLKVFDVEELNTHGGSLRIHACHEENSISIENSIDRVKTSEKNFGLSEIGGYKSFALKVNETKRKLLDMLIQAKDEGKRIIGYGAPAKGNTLLNYCGIRTDFIDYTVDTNPYKQNKYLPGTHIPVLHPDEIRKTTPDYILILPWNIKDEIISQLQYVKDWNGKFIIPIPEVNVIA